MTSLDFHDRLMEMGACDSAASTLLLASCRTWGEAWGYSTRIGCSERLVWLLMKAGLGEPQSVVRRKLVALLMLDPRAVAHSCRYSTEYTRRDLESMLRAYISGRYVTELLGTRAEHITLGTPLHAIIHMEDALCFGTIGGLANIVGSYLSATEVARHIDCPIMGDGFDGAE